MPKRVTTMLHPARLVAITCGTIIAVAGLVGCGDGEPIAKMTSAEQQRQPLDDQLRNAASVNAPVYWLGRRYGKVRLLAVLASPPEPGANFQYGFEPFNFSSCSGTCLSLYSVATTANRRGQLEDSRRPLSRSCARVIQRQIVIGCDEDETWLVLRGRQAVLITDENEYLNEARARKMIAALRPFGADEGEADPTTAVLTERELEGLSARATAVLDDAFSHLR